MSCEETPFNKTTRLGLEARIKDHFTKGDIHVVDEILDIYPTGRPRPEVSLELARHAIQTDNRPYTYDTVELPIVKAA